MSKNEFLKQLRAYLSDVVSPAEAEDSVRYYSSYIDGQIQNGRSEAEVIAELGDPRIIGRSIADASRRQNARGGRKAAADSHDRPDMGGDGQETQNGRTASSWKRWKLYGILAIAVLVILAVLIAVTRVIAFFFPLIAVIVVLTWIMRRMGGLR